MDEVKLKNIKPFDNLTITDAFMFGAVMNEPKYLKPLLEYILGIKFSKITCPEKQMPFRCNTYTRDRLVTAMTPAIPEPYTRVTV